MKRLPLRLPSLSALLLWGLVGCGALPQPQPPSTGELLGAATRLNLAGSAVQAQADPVVSGEGLNIRLTLQAANRRAALPPLSLSQVYVVTRDGVWRTSVGAALKACGTGCARVEVRGDSRGMERGAAQVVVEIMDKQGRRYLLRDEVAKVR